MSETDSFIQEVNEEVRQDQMFALWKKWGPLVIGGVVVVVGGAAFWSWQTSQARLAAEQRGGTFIAADPEVVDQQLALPGQVDGAAQVIARLSAAAALVSDGRHDDAIAAYAGVVDMTDIAPEYRDLARLQLARQYAETGNADQARAEIGELMAPEAPFRLLALELRAALSLQAGDLEAGHADLNTILADTAATTEMAQRATAMLTATGGTPVTLAQ